jgi:hypothetical protein
MNRKRGEAKYYVDYIYPSFSGDLDAGHEASSQLYSICL